MNLPRPTGILTGCTNFRVHWLPQPAQISTITACGLDIDGTCEKHLISREPHRCRTGLAWTRSTDLKAFAEIPNYPTLLICPTCGKAAWQAAGIASDPVQGS